MACVAIVVPDTATVSLLALKLTMVAYLHRHTIFLPLREHPSGRHIQMVFPKDYSQTPLIDAVVYPA